MWHGVFTLTLANALKTFQIWMLTYIKDLTLKNLIVRLHSKFHKYSHNNNALFYSQNQTYRIMVPKISSFLIYDDSASAKYQPSMYSVLVVKILLPSSHACKSWLLSIVIIYLSVVTWQNKLFVFQGRPGTFTKLLERNKQLLALI